MFFLKILLTAVNSKYIHSNLAIRYIRSYCKYFDTEIKEYSINDNINSIISGIIYEDPDVVSFSCYIWNIEIINKICSSIKKINPKIITIFGGPEVSYDSADIMEKNKYIDFIIKGEGEETSYQLFSYLDGKENDINKIDGIVYKDNGSIIENNDRELIQELDKIPFPYRDEDDLNNKIVYYESSRGCPFRCSYCLSSTIKGVRFFSIERVKCDLLWFINRNIPLVKFVDRTFNCGKYYRDILKFIIDNKKNTRFHFEISADLLDGDTIKLLNTAPKGLIQFEAGIQTTNMETLSTVDRHMDFGKLKANLDSIISKKNINVHLDLIAGLPKEDFNSFIKSFNESFTLKPDMLQLGFLKLLKGSNLRESAHKYGIEFNEYPPYEVLKTDSISYSEIDTLKNVEEIVDNFYNSGRFQASLLYLLSYTDTPFKLFLDISKFKDRCIKRGKKLNNIGQYKLIYDFSKGIENIDLSILSECLLFDYLSQGRNPNIPQFIKPKVILNKNTIWSILKNLDTEIYGDRSWKNIQAAAFTFDMVRFINTGEIVHNQTLLVFDYENKDEYGKAEYISIDLKGILS
jgi:radical SAM superfamily enzyme YgiQ (UPF0313 family)